MSKKILMIVTSNAKMGETNKPTGIWAEELAAPYYQFVDAGLSVDIASPKGGTVPFDAGSLKPQGQNSAAVDRMLADAPLNGRLNASLKVDHVDATKYDAIFFPGGHGTMWDLPNDAGVTKAVEQVWSAPSAATANPFSTANASILLRMLKKLLPDSPASCHSRLSRGFDHSAQLLKVLPTGRRLPCAMATS
jgi:putative intracellular protease/amidase